MVRRGEVRRGAARFMGGFGQPIEIIAARLPAMVAGQLQRGAARLPASVCYCCGSVAAKCGKGAVRCGPPLKRGDRTAPHRTRRARRPADGSGGSFLAANCMRGTEPRTVKKLGPISLTACFCFDC